MTPLRRRFIDDMSLHNLAPRTVKTYVSRVAQFAHYFGRSPADLGMAEVRAGHLVDMGAERKKSTHRADAPHRHPHPSQGHHHG